MPLMRNTLSWTAFLEQIGHSAVNRHTREESTYPGGTELNAGMRKAFYFSVTFPFFLTSFKKVAEFRSTNKYGKYGNKYVEVFPTSESE